MCGGGGADSLVPGASTVNSHREGIITQARLEYAGRV